MHPEPADGHGLEVARLLHAVERDGLLQRIHAQRQPAQPQRDADRRLYEALVAADYATWQGTSLPAFEHAGQQEVLNWCALLGAMQELGAPLDWSDFVGTEVFNSNKVFAVYGAV